ncbi:unnamed protein product, partial [Effrenium voratum]
GENCEFSHEVPSISMGRGGTIYANAPIRVKAGVQSLPAPKFKTQICKYFLEGSCFKGDECSYAHGAEQLQAPGPGAGLPAESSFKTKMCLYHLQGTCFKGEACTYAHSEEELSGAAESNFKTKMCLWHLQGQCVRGDACTFAHDESELMEPGALVPQGAQALPMPPVVPSLVPTPSKFKTQLCKFYLEGTCFKGDECSYAHGEDQLQAGGAPEGAPGEPLPMPPVVPSLVPSLVPTPSKFKTQICKFYLEGTCFKGDECSYAHGEEQLQANDAVAGVGPESPNFKTKICLYYLQGKCFRGEACSYAHSEEELAAGPAESNFKTKMCLFHLQGICVKGDACRWAHDERELTEPGVPQDPEPGEPLPMPPVVPSLVPSLVLTPSKFKTQICKFYLEGTCFKGDECSYAHGEDQLQAGPATGESSFKTKICVYHLQGKCFRGEACSYAHSEEELAPGAGGVGDAGPVGPESPNFKTKICVYYLQGKCFRGEACSYAHSEEELAPGAEPSFKTKMCNFYLQGQCVKGGACKFAHGELAMPPPPRALPAGTNGNRYGIIVPSLARKGG